MGMDNIRCIISILFRNIGSPLVQYFVYHCVSGNSKSGMYICMYLHTYQNYVHLVVEQAVIFCSLTGMKYIGNWNWFSLTFWQEDEGILQAYVKSWSSGALDRARARESISFTLALHHISCFIFKPDASEKSSLQRKLARSLLRSYSQKPHQEVTDHLNSQLV